MARGGWHGIRAENRVGGARAAYPKEGMPMQMEATATSKPRPAPDSRARIHLESESIRGQGPWMAPRPGIKVRELYQSGDSYRISMVRYAPGAKVPEHVHTGDEHSYVLEGSVRDAAGEYPAGSYLLSPMGSRHAVWSDRGALVLTHRLGPIRFLSGWRPGQEAPKEGRGAPQLYQLTQDRESLLIDTGSETGAAWEALCPGVQIMSMFEGSPGNYKTALVRYRPGSSIPAHIHLGDEHVYVLSGCQEDEYDSYDAGAYIYNPMGTTHRVWSEEGCLALIHWRAQILFL